jgi:co-chaperonin GroES (HSP10)
MNIKAPIGRILVNQQPVETEIGEFVVDQEGRDDSVRGEVIAIGEDITDIKVGDTVVYPRSRGIRVFNEEGEVHVVQYLSLHYILPI